MPAGIETWLQAHSAWIGWLSLISVATFIVTLVAVPLLIIRLPADYFAHRERPTSHWNPHQPLRALTLLAKNLLGGVLVLAGVVMLVLPGQGILTILIGVSLLDFPGKFAAQRWLVERPKVARSMDWVRRRAGRAPFVLHSPPPSK